MGVAVLELNYGAVLGALVTHLSNVVKTTWVQSMCGLRVLRWLKRSG